MNLKDLELKLLSPSLSEDTIISEYIEFFNEKYISKIEVYKILRDSGKFTGSFKEYSLKKHQDKYGICFDMISRKDYPVGIIVNDVVYFANRIIEEYGTIVAVCGDQQIDVPIVKLKSFEVIEV